MNSQVASMNNKGSLSYKKFGEIAILALSSRSDASKFRSDESVNVETIFHGAVVTIIFEKMRPS